MSLRTISGIEDLVQRTNVPRTKQFYAINRALVEYANGIFPKEWLEFILQKPLRGNEAYAQSLYHRYFQLFRERVPIENNLIRELCLPGYIFYRYFNADILLADL